MTLAIIQTLIFGGDTPWLLLAAPVALAGAGLVWLLSPKGRR